MSAKSNKIEHNEELITSRRKEQSLWDVMPPLYRDKNEKKNKSLKRMSDKLQIFSDRYFRIKFYLNPVLWNPVLRRVLQNHRCLSVCLSVRQLRVFLRNGSIVLSDFWHDSRKMKYLKTDRAFFSRKIHFCPIGQKRLKMAPKSRFLDCLKNFAISFCHQF